MSSLAASAQELDEVAEGFKRDLDKALAELAQLRDRIADERFPVVRERDEAERAVIEKRKEFARLERSNENQLVELSALKAEVKGLTDESRYLSGLLADYMRGFETQIHISEAGRFDPMIAAAQEADANDDLSASEKADLQMDLVAASIGRVENLVGGNVFEGEALSPAGKLVGGRFALIGPVAVFAADEAGAAGVAKLQLGSPEPTVAALDEGATTAIQSLISSGSGMLPVDATGGDALKIAATKDNLFKHMEKGGPVMVPIIGLGILAILTALLKWIQLSRIRTVAPADLNLILTQIRAGHPEKALQHARSFKGMVGEMMEEAVGNVKEKKEYLEEILYEKMLSARPTLEKFVPIIALTAATAPLLGLLGTVTGMINTFNMITVYGTGDPRTLSGGISEALITTKFGLVVAVPALICHAIISRKIKGVLGSMEQMTVGFINGVPEPGDPDARFNGKSTEERVNYV